MLIKSPGFTTIAALSLAPWNRAVLMTTLSDLLPALRSSHVDPVMGLKDRAVGSPRLRTGRVLVVAQLAVSLSLLAGADRGPNAGP
jgi:hypothetical protein